MAKLLISILLFLILLVGVNAIHFRFLAVNVVLYSALEDALVAAGISGLISWYFIFKRDIPGIVFVQLLIIFVLIGYIFAITVPTIIDRSFSVYILEKIQQHKGGLRQTAFDHLMIDEFGQEHHLTEARLTEQLQSGTIAIHSGCIMLTKKGDRIASLTRWYRQNMLPQHRLLMNTYTNDLTNPFKQPSKITDTYSCKN